MEEALPPMAEMWDEWRKNVALSFNPSDARANYTWSSDPSPAVHALMKQAGFSVAITKRNKKLLKPQLHPKKILDD